VRVAHADEEQNQESGPAHLLDGHLLPVAFELLGDELGEAGMRALTHLRAHDADHAGVVGLDGDPYVEFGAAIGGDALRQRGAEARRQVEAQRESPSGGGGADDEFAARKLRGFVADDLVHDGPLQVLDVSLAAMWTAVRTR
jgi:hypothetical protein